MKSGILRQNTFIHTASGLVVKVRKGTKVFVEGGVITFNPIESVQVTRVQGKFFACLWGEVSLITFPKDGLLIEQGLAKAPYPLSML